MINSLLQLLKERDIRIIVVFGVVLAALLYLYFVRAPSQFPAGHLITIEEGVSITEAVRLLEEERVVSSSSFLGILTRYFSESGVHSGTYTFEKHLSVFSVWHRIITGDTGAPTVRITIPEGATTREMAEIFSGRIIDFDPEYFREIAKPKEGYLFPETYIISSTASEELIVSLMEKTFFEKIVEIQQDIDAFDKSLDEVVVMASILEKEARLYETRQKVAGILWKRISIGMPLQVDAVFGYIYDRDTFSPTFDQLTATDSPYNTYKHKDLPPGAISNPGISSLKAAVNPIKSPYFYYLTGADGTMHYSETFDQHVANRRFLR